MNTKKDGCSLKELTAILVKEEDDIKLNRSRFIVMVLPRCLLPVILIVPLVSLITHPEALILLILEPSKFNLNLPLIGGSHHIHFLTLRGILHPLLLKQD